MNMGRVLVVEDEAITAMAIEVELQNAGYVVCGRVASGEDVASAIARGEPDIVIMDIRLSGAMDGIEAAAAIRCLSELPLIFMTGYDNDSMRDRAMALHPLGYLVKPVDFGDLIRAVAEGLAQR